MREYREVKLNLTKEQTRAFIDWLANDPEEYWGHTICDYEVDWCNQPITKFIINGHELWDYSGQHHQVVIDHCYCPTQNATVVALDKKEYEALDYCMMKMGF